MKQLLILLITPLLFARFSPADKLIGNYESEAQTYLKLYTTVTGTGDDRQENWLLANNGTRRIIATVEIIAPPDADNKDSREKKMVLVDPKESVNLGIRSVNGSTPNTVVIVKAAFTPTP